MRLFRLCVCGLLSTLGRRYLLSRLAWATEWKCVRRPHNVAHPFDRGTHNTHTVCCLRVLAICKSIARNCNRLFEFTSIEIIYLICVTSPRLLRFSAAHFTSKMHSFLMIANDSETLSLWLICHSNRNSNVGLFASIVVQYRCVDRPAVWKTPKGTETNKVLTAFNTSCESGYLDPWHLNSHRPQAVRREECTASISHALAY